MIHRAMRFYRTNQPNRLSEQLKSFWDVNIGETQSLDETLYAFLLSFLGTNGERWLGPLGRIFQQAHRANETEYSRLVSHFESVRLDRFEAYADILSEYFNGFTESNQTLDYVLGELEMPIDAVATSSDFDTTRMYYGNAFELLGSSLDLPASINNVLSGRRFDELKTISLSKFRTLNKANRVGAFADNGDLSRLVKEYDSAIRNASHHRWFRINEGHTKITYRSGGTGYSYDLLCGIPSSVQQNYNSNCPIGLLGAAVAEHFRYIALRLATSRSRGRISLMESLDSNYPRIFLNAVQCLSSSV